MEEEAEEVEGEDEEEEDEDEEDDDKKDDAEEDNHDHAVLEQRHVDTEQQIEGQEDMQHDHELQPQPHSAEVEQEHKIDDNDVEEETGDEKLIKLPIIEYKSVQKQLDEAEEPQTVKKRKVKKVVGDIHLKPRDLKIVGQDFCKT